MTIIGTLQLEELINRRTVGQLISRTSTVYSCLRSMGAVSIQPLILSAMMPAVTCLITTTSRSHIRRLNVIVGCIVIIWLFVMYCIVLCYVILYLQCCTAVMPYVVILLSFCCSVLCYCVALCCDIIVVLL